MSGFLWESIAFGPIKSRRLGSSLGINVLPVDEKICSFDCIYCECGWTLEKNLTTAHYYPWETIIEAIEEKLKVSKKNHVAIDSITFSGNGEPTLHPDFGNIIDHLIRLRDSYYPGVVITCLSNSTQLGREDVLEALKKIENPILKLDAGTEELYQLINKPLVPVSLQEIVSQLQSFNGNLIIQTLFFKGTIDGVDFDNSAEPNLSEWLHHIAAIHPRQVMLYSLDRETPASHLVKFPKEKLEKIADLVRKLDIETAIY